LAVRIQGAVCYFAFLSLAIGGLTACSSTGPAERDLINASTSDRPSFALVDLSRPSLEVVANWPRPSFKAVYGDYRSPAVHRVGVGDGIRINIWESSNGSLFGRSATTQASAGSSVSTIPDQIVARDGSINVPYAGRLKVVGKTTVQIEKQIVSRLAGRTADPQAMVSLSQNVSYSTTVTGDVKKAARVPLSPKGDRILDVVAAAGGISAPVHEAFITLSRDGSSLSVPLRAILSDPKENVYVRPRDIVTVYRAPQSFTAFGATGKNAVIGFDAGGITLDEAMGKAGGLRSNQADPKGVFVLRYEPVDLVRNYPNIPPHLLESNIVAVAYRLDMRDPTSLFRARRFVMRDKDILYVSHAPITQVEQVARIFGMMVSPAAAAGSIYSNTR